MPDFHRASRTLPARVSPFRPRVSKAWEGLCSARRVDRPTNRHRALSMLGSAPQPCVLRACPERARPTPASLAMAQRGRTSGAFRRLDQARLSARNCGHLCDANQTHLHARTYSDNSGQALCSSSQPRAVEPGPALHRDPAARWGRIRESSQERQASPGRLRRVLRRSWRFGSRLQPRGQLSLFSRICAPLL